MVCVLNEVITKTQTEWETNSSMQASLLAYCCFLIKIYFLLYLCNIRLEQIIFTKIIHSYPGHGTEIVL